MINYNYGIKVINTTNRILLLYSKINKQRLVHFTFVYKYLYIRAHLYIKIYKLYKAGELPKLPAVPYNRTCIYCMKTYMMCI